MVLTLLIITYILVQPVKAKEIEIDVIPVTNLDLDLSTMCSQASQFGLTQMSTVYFEDVSAVVLNQSYLKIDNEIGRGHALTLNNSGYLEGWFDTRNNAVYANFGDGFENKSDWFLTIVGESDDVLNQSLGKAIDYKRPINFVHNAIQAVNGNFTLEATTSEGKWYKSTQTVDIPSSLGITPCRTQMRVFIPSSSDYVTQVDFVLHYDANDMGVTHEIYEYEFEFGNEYSCEVPAIVTEAVRDYDTQLKLYHNMMR